MEDSQGSTDRRDGSRRQVRIRCRVDWGEETIQGDMVNISMGGALIASNGPLPPKEEWVKVGYSYRKGESVFEGSIRSRVVRTTAEIPQEDGLNAFAVQFHAPREQIRSELAPLLKALAEA